MPGQSKKTFFQKISAYHRKLWSARIIPFMVTNSARIFFYRLIGYKNIDKTAFIGMRCYLDDLEPKMLIVEEGATISYGVFFACHGAKQGHNTITIKKNAYIGMRSIVISPHKEGIMVGENSIIGAGSLVNRSVPDNEVWAGNPIRRISN